MAARAPHLAPIIYHPRNIMGESMTLGTARVNPGSSPMLFRGALPPADMPSALPSYHVSLGVPYLLLRPRCLVFDRVLPKGGSWRRSMFLGASSYDQYGMTPDCEMMATLLLQVAAECRSFRMTGFHGLQYQGHTMRGIRCVETSAKLASWRHGADG